MYVCPLRVYQVKIYGFRHSLRTCLARTAHNAIAMEIEVENSEDRRRCQNESRCMGDG